MEMDKEDQVLFTIVLFSLVALLALVIFSGPARSSTWQPEYTGQKDRYNEGALRHDPEVLVSPARINPSQNQPGASTPESTIERLDREIKSMTYSETAKTIAESADPEQVRQRQAGNCFEIARLAWFELLKEGYVVHLINLKIAKSNVWHTICAFKEIDGTWSYFQAAGQDHMGYFPKRAADIEIMIKDDFSPIADIKIIS